VKNQYARYEPALVDDDLAARERYFAAVWDSLGECNIVFFDSDNGIEVKSVKPGARNSAKYVYWSELQAAYTRGHSVLVYQHFPRVKREPFVRSLSVRLAAKLGNARVAAFQTAHVVFLLALQPAHVDALSGAIEQVRVCWPDQIKVEVTSW
jgi:hypothetical protein